MMKVADDHRPFLKFYSSWYIKAGKEEAIKTHKGFQSLNIAEIPSFQQHEANQRAISKVAYREDWDEEKGKNGLLRFSNLNSF